MHIEQTIPTNSQLNNYPHKEELQSDIDETYEQNKMVLRFDDLSKKGQLKLSKLIKQNSPIYTIKKPPEQGGVTINEIFHSLRITNPKIMTNGGWNNRFCFGSLNRKLGQNLSQIIYYLTRRKPTESTINNIKTKIKTQRYNCSIQEPSNIWVNTELNMRNFFNQYAEEATREATEETVEMTEETIREEQITRIRNSNWSPFIRDGAA